MRPADSSCMSPTLSPFGALPFFCSDDESDEYTSKRPPAPKAKRAAPKAKAAKGGDDAGSDGEGVDGYFDSDMLHGEKMWKRGGTKWKTLEHGGVLFPPPYTPHGVKFLYAGDVVPLTAPQEEVFYFSSHPPISPTCRTPLSPYLTFHSCFFEVATMYAAMKETDYAKKDVFNKNFMSSWRELLVKTPGEYVSHSQSFPYAIPRPSYIAPYVSPYNITLQSHRLFVWSRGKGCQGAEQVRLWTDRAVSRRPQGAEEGDEQG